MKTVQMSQMIAMLQAGHSQEVIIQGMIDEQIMKGFHALHESIMVEFARAHGQWGAAEQKEWRTTNDAYLIEGKIRASMKTYTRGF